MIDGILESYAAMEPAMKIFVTLGSVSSCVLFIQMIFLIIFYSAPFLIRLVAFTTQLVILNFQFKIASLKDFSYSKLSQSG